MILVPAGEAIFGSREDDARASWDENPRSAPPPPRPRLCGGAEACLPALSGHPGPPLRPAAHGTGSRLLTCLDAAALPSGQPTPEAPPPRPPVPVPGRGPTPLSLAGPARSAPPSAPAPGRAAPRTGPASHCPSCSQSDTLCPRRFSPCRHWVCPILPRPGWRGPPQPSTVNGTPSGALAALPCRSVGRHPPELAPGRRDCTCARW